MTRILPLWALGRGGAKSESSSSLSSGGLFMAFELLLKMQAQGRTEKKGGKRIDNQTGNDPRPHRTPARRKRALS